VRRNCDENYLFKKKIENLFLGKINKILFFINLVGIFKIKDLLGESLKLRAIPFIGNI
jgi:hypothetical protein